MAKMVSLKKTEAERADEKDALGEAGPAAVGLGKSENDGVQVHLEHHHLKHMGVTEGMKAGDDVDFRGRGKVERYDTHDDGNGEPRHSATLRFDKGSLEHDGGERDGGEGRAGLKEEIAKNVGKMEKEAK